MEKIEVELTPVRIVEKPTATGNAGGGVIPLRFQAVFKSTGVLENKDVIIPNPIVFEVPQEYVGRYALAFNLGGVIELSNTVEFYHNIEPVGLQDSDTTFNLDVFVLPAISAEPIVTQEIDIEIVERQLTADWQNVPTVMLVGSSNNYLIRDNGNQYSSFENIIVALHTNNSIDYKTLNNISSNERLYLEITDNIGETVQVSVRANVIKTERIPFENIISIKAVYENLVSGLRFEHPLSLTIPM